MSAGRWHSASCSRAGVLALTLSLLLAAGCATAPMRPGPATTGVEVGVASYYAGEHHHRRTAQGGRFDPHELTAAHRTLPFGTHVRVTNLDNGHSTVVTITDRGPFRRGRIIDVSKRAARVLGFVREGTARVRLEVVER
jgi:rare lipoprotein A